MNRILEWLLRVLPWTTPTEQLADEGERARRQAEEELRQARAQTGFYEALGVAFRDQYERNHLQEALSSLFRGDEEAKP